MKRITQEELDIVVENHQLWINGEGGKRADLSFTDLKWLNLKGKDLRGVNFEGANLRGVNLMKAVLTGVNLEGADLELSNLKLAGLGWANLKRVNFTWANLRNANLEGANLKGVCLWETSGDGKYIKTIQITKYTVTYTPDFLQIGCEGYPIKDWFEFDNERISSMDEGALKWWNEYKEYIKLSLKMNPAQPTMY